MNFFKGVSITDIIDILIVTYVIYKLILLVRGTRAVQLLKGIVVVVFTWAVSIWFDLLTLQWMMNQMFTFGVLAVIIIFQPELRRALEQLGRGKLFTRSSMDEEQEFARRIGEVIKSVNYFAKRKIGALIVFERNTGLNDYIESGVQLKAQITSELIMNIFTPNTPLHDGAVIIQQQLIMGAGCYLPLAENPFISKELGTRHRAAIGISEVSDSIAIVVSEETGKISLAMNGQIVRDISDEALINKLFDELRQPHRQNKQRDKISFWKSKGDQHG